MTRNRMNGQASTMSAERDVLRGVLMLLVILDHNDIVRNVRSVQDWFLPMTLHVAGFLMLPFLGSSMRLNRAEILDRAIRYLVPFIAAVTAYAIAFHLLIEPGAGLASTGANYVVALAIASPLALQPSTGFIVLWFLPALFATVLLAGFIDAARPARRTMLIATTLAVHATIGAAPEWLKTWMPQGVAIAAYIVPLGLLARWLVATLKPRSRPLLIAAVCAGLVVACWKTQLGIEIEVATLDLPTWRNPLQMLATDAADLAFLLLLVAAAPWLARIAPLVLLGRHSLVVYLAHPLLSKAIIMALLPLSAQLLGAGSSLAYWGLAAASVVLVAAGSIAAAATIAAVPALRSLVTPRDLPGWLPVLLLAAGRRQSARLQT